MTYHIIVTCWIIFVLYWLVSAISTKKTRSRQSSVESLTHRLPFAAGLILVFCPQLIRPLDFALFPHSLVCLAIAEVLCITGLAIALWSRSTLAGNWSGDVVLKQDHELIQKGPYRFVRHPIYTGILLLLLGTALATGRAACFVGFVIAVGSLWVKLKFEESFMVTNFGDEYIEYKSRVKALIPFVL